MKHTTWLATVFAIVLGGAASAADVLAPPQWSSDQVRAARDTAAVPSLVLTLERLVDSHGPAKTEAVTLAGDFTLIDDSGQEFLFDHKLCRVLAWRAGDHVFSNDSCYAGVAFRVFELQNRQLLNKAMASVGAKGAPTSPYWDETELGIQSDASNPLARTEVADGTDYRLGDQVVVSVRGPTTLASPERVRAFVRFLADTAELHPQVRRDLLAAGGLPHVIEIKSQARGRPRTETITIKAVQERAVPYPLSAGLVSKLREAANSDPSAEQRGVAATLKVIDHVGDPRPPSLQSLADQFARDADEHRPLAATLDFMELAQLHAGELQTDAGVAVAKASLQPRLQAVADDPAAAPFWAASRAAGGDGDAAYKQAAAKYLAGAKIDDLPFGTFRYVTFANIVASAGDTSKWDPAILNSMPSLTDGIWLHIARYPWGANAYKDLGDKYLVGYDMTDAWLAFDLGRSVDPTWRASVMESLSDFEDKMRAGQPDFF